MQYYLYKLKFPSGVHFGSEKEGIGLENITPNCHCDTFFSALCIEILGLEGENGLETFCKKTENGEFLFSDLLPFVDDDFLIPKPILFNDKKADEQVGDSVKKKMMKKLQFVSVTKLKEYFNGEAQEPYFSETALYEKSSPSRADEKNGLYSVAVTRFKENCGLYFIVKMNADKKEWFDRVIKSLSLSGLGGKRTAGYGRFEVEEEFELLKDTNKPNASVFADLLEKESPFYLSLSAFYPNEDDIEDLKDGYYTLLPRQGYIQSQTYSDKIAKKLPTVMINAGSCFRKRFSGRIADLKNGGEHSVYRYGKPIMIGIDI